MKKILVATDGTPGSEGAVKVAIELARSRNLPLEVLTVLEPTLSFALGAGEDLPEGAPLLRTMQEEDRRATVTRQLEELDPTGSSTITSKIGSPPLLITEYAREIGANLIVLGSGPQFVGDHWLRNEVALKVIRLASAPILLVPQLVQTQPRSALVAIDFSDFSFGAARAAADLVGEEGRLTLTHVMWDEGEFDALPSLAQYNETYRAGVTARLDKLAGELRESARVRTETAILQGEPGPEIVSLASRLNVDVVAAGSHGYGFFSRIIMGSISTQLIRGTRQCVLIVPPSSIPGEVQRHAADALAESEAATEPPAP